MLLIQKLEDSFLTSKYWFLEIVNFVQMDSFLLYLHDIYRVETVVRKKKVEIECQKALSRKEENFNLIFNALQFLSSMSSN